MAAVRRDIAPFLQRVRAFLLGREHTVALRFEDGLADRTQPQPELPDGPSHIYSANYYCTRDGRREVQPPIDLVQQQKVLDANAGDATAAASKASQQLLPTPGKVYAWD
ncbi:NADH dehydrogenase [ubiquinone] 1 alpha subcomplex subunit 7 [Drosophila grimshawi]|uniref:NADH dehydrogenase [ubiquinone] 1 alpha subcomplex subunit 7 n=1 Tax=Drosophila grimshawi TaxID=7222 RepID=B4JXE1_DROGR|nr:NADH dehydrogenase [ubiquinone] 1 alpha subcomplex subunit 7 [Drosophila grimshawi]EDV95417.1 GH17584 [Drosophila grimshawi]